MPLIGRIAAATARAYGLFANIAQAVDPYFNYVVTLLHGDGTNGGQNNTFLDSSTNNFTITRNGNTTQGSFSPFSQTGWSNYFDGTGDYLTVPNNTAFNQTADFSEDCWVYITGNPANGTYQYFGSADGNPYFQIGLTSGGKFVFAKGYNPDLITSSFTAVANTWYHVAITRVSNTCRLFVNGVLQGTATDSASTSITGSYPFTISGLSGSSYVYPFTGYISNFRFVRGGIPSLFSTSSTTAGAQIFTPPTTAYTGSESLTAGSVSLLTCQSNRFIDKSANAFTITRNGDTSVQPFSPFNPTTAYSTSSIGGSGYFDGSGDYLSLSQSTAMSLGTGDFTVEAWVYPTANPSSFWSIIDARGSASNIPWAAGLRLVSGALKGTFFNGADIQGTITVPLNAWTHVAFARSGTTLKSFINGAVDINTTMSTNLTAGTTQYVGAIIDPTYNTGYLSDVRVVKGTAVYTAAFTPPTAPLTAITNTQLLLSYTNGAIFDNAAVADYETVGNAQISTSVKKYGTGSIAFDGTGDRLVAPNNGAVLTLGTGDFTVEMWVYANTVATTWQGLIDWRPSDTSTYPALVLNTSTIKWVKFGGAMITSFAISASTWYHVAICRAGSSTKLFINGTQAGSTYTDTNDYLSASTIRVGSTFASEDLNGYIDDLRISKGIARYTYNFTPPTAALPDIGGTITLTADPYYEYTTLLLPGNGTNGAQNNTFLDSSTNAFTITRNGNTTQGTFSPFSQTGWGNYFDGTGDYLTLAPGAAFAFGTGDFTVETWFYYTGLQSPNTQYLFDARNSGQTNTWAFHANPNANTIVWFNGSSDFSSSSTISINQWNHVAYVRSGTTGSMYFNGVRVGTQTDSTNYSVSPTTSYIGIRYSIAESILGYMSNARVVKGTAVYSGTTYTVPIAPLTAITNTSLLICQSNRFIDNSTNAFAITRNGDVSVQAFSPFNPTASWSAATYGGSGYFDGSGDYLTLSGGTPLTFGTGDFTIEFWYYSSNSGVQQILYDGRPAGTNGLYITLYKSTGNVLELYVNNAVVISGATVVNTTSWNHVALSRSGTSTKLFLNGVQQGSTYTDSNNYLNGTSRPVIGADGATIGNLPLNGYLSDLRVLKGTALYTAAFTPPTAPLTAITNTQLLLSCTNAGIYDATSKNDLETVGNAQISTTQSKFGGSSMYFDGTGDYVAIPATQGITFGTADFTIEMWVYSGSQSGTSVRMMGNGAGGSWASGKYVLTTTSAANPNKFTLGVNNASPADLLVSNTTFNDSVWRHVAITRYGNVFRLFVNGIQESTNTSSISVDNGVAAQIRIGSGGISGDADWAGYIDDLRITKGIARYTSNFTPPTTAFLTL